MATWEDGPEYAPLERPSEFSPPSTGPLQTAPPAERPAPLVPQDRPQFDGPLAPVPPLAELVPVVADRRDPGVPFAVAASTLTSMDSAWGAAHWSGPAGPTGGAQATPSTYGAITPWGGPAVTSWPSPQTPLPPVGGPQSPAGGFPPPGTPQWFGPGPTAPVQEAAPAELNLKAVLTAATPGLLICLAIGGLIYPLAPIMLGLAFVLSSRVQVASQQIRSAFFIAFGFLAFFALAGLMAGRIWFADWWSYVGAWALVICWAMLGTMLIAVYRALKRRTPQPPRDTPGWA